MRALHRSIWWVEESTYYMPVWRIDSISWLFLRLYIWQVLILSCNSYDILIDMHKWQQDNESMKYKSRTDYMFKYVTSRELKLTVIHMASAHFQLEFVNHMTILYGSLSTSNKFSVLYVLIITYHSYDHMTNLYGIPIIRPKLSYYFLLYI